MDQSVTFRAGFGVGSACSSWAELFSEWVSVTLLYLCCRTSHSGRGKGGGGGVSSRLEHAVSALCSLSVTEHCLAQVPLTFDIIYEEIDRTKSCEWVPAITGFMPPAALCNCNPSTFDPCINTFKCWTQNCIKEVTSESSQYKQKIQIQYKLKKWGIFLVHFNFWVNVKSDDYSKMGCRLD